MNCFGCFLESWAFCSITEYRHKTIWKWLDFKYVKNKCALQVMLFVSQNMYQFTSAEHLSGQYYEVNIVL